MRNYGVCSRMLRLKRLRRSAAPLPKAPQWFAGGYLRLKQLEEKA